MDKMFKYRLGLEARDLITGFTGLITARVQFITGCNNYKISPKVGKDGEAKEGVMFDENQIEIIGQGVHIPGTNTEVDNYTKVITFDPKKKTKAAEVKGGQHDKVWNSNKL